MRDFIIPYYSRIQELLLEASTEDSDLEELGFIVNNLKEEFYNELEKRTNSFEEIFEGEDAVEGLFIKYEHFFSEESFFANRDPETHLAIKLDLGFGYNYPPCPYTEEDFSVIQKNITDFISQRVKKSEDDLVKPLLSGVAKVQLSQKQIDFLVNNFISISHTFTDYVDFYDRDGNWNWLMDCRFIVQYVFEKSVELTYATAKGEKTDDFSYDIREAFTYFQIPVSGEIQEHINSVVKILEDIVMDITNFIDKNDYHLCDKEIWFRPILFNIALDGMIFTLENAI